jgi:2-polyprenyl-3-methyl-5-hydroxy-6-metoxy-1,4-benzoquinol methylase
MIGMTVPADPKARAILTHSEQAPRFAEAYARAALDPFSSCFTYSRLQLDSWLARLIPAAQPGQRLLDVGCGTGEQLLAMARRGYEVAGLDGSAEMLQHARAANPGVTLELGDVEHLPYADGSFDVALCVEVLRYLPQEAPVLREMARVLKPGGICVATATPLLNLNGYWLVNRLASALRPKGLTPLRQYFTTPGALERAARSAGFEDVEVHGVYLGPINWVERLVPRALPSLLRGWRRWDAAIADRRGTRGLSNMLVMRARRA